MVEGLCSVPAACIVVDADREIRVVFIAFFYFLIDRIICVRLSAHQDADAMPHKLITARERDHEIQCFFLESVRGRSGIRASVTG